MQSHRRPARLLNLPKVLGVLVLLFVSLTVADKTMTLAKLLTKGCRLHSLKHIPKIDCDNKELTSLPKELPKTLFNLQFPNNNLTTFPCVSLPFLHILNLRNNTITDFPGACLREMPRLTDLDLSHNHLSCIKLFSVRNFLRNLKKLDLSFNHLKAVSWCDLGFTYSGRVPYEGIIIGNPFHCDCDIAWLIAMARLGRECQSDKTGISHYRACLDEIETNSLLREFTRQPYLFRCKTPPELVDVELFRLNISHCPYCVNQNKAQSETCPLDPCPTGYSDVSTSSSQSPVPTATELAKPKFKQTELYGVVPNAKDISNLTNTTPMAARTFGQIQVSSEMFTPLVKGTHSVTVTEMPQNSSKSSPQPDTPFSGWILTAVVVALIVVICGVVLVVFWILVRIKAGKTVQLDTNVHDQKSCPTADSKPDSDPGVYEEITDEEEPYAKSYVFDVPQYEITNLKISHG